MWNASYPCENIIYVYTNMTDNNTIVFAGDEIVTPDVKEIYEQYKLENKELHQRFNDKLRSLKVNPYGMQVYARNMFVQTKHLDANNKTIYKTNVIDKIKNQFKQ